MITQQNNYTINNYTINNYTINNYTINNYTINNYTKNSASERYAVFLRNHHKKLNEKSKIYCSSSK
jgi:hypothetical protein